MTGADPTTEPLTLNATVPSGGQVAFVTFAASVTGSLYCPETEATATALGGALTVTVEEHWLVAPLLSVTVRSTFVVPTGYGPAGVCVIVKGSPSGSKDPLSMEAFAAQPAPA